MIKQLKYTGITSRPTDYDSPDGDLHIAVNVVNEDGALREVCEPCTHPKTA